MLRFVVPALLLSPALIPAAAAQDMQTDSAGEVRERGNPERDLQMRMTLLRNAPEQVKVNCWKLGCVLIVNETAGYNVTGFYLDTARPGKKPAWSGNQLDTPLEPSKMTLRFKTGNKDTCNIPVRFVLVRQGTRERAEIDGTTSFCTSPHNDTLIRIRMQEGKVYVGEGEAVDADTPH